MKARAAGQGSGSGGESREGIPHWYVAAGSRAGARGLPRGPVGVQQRLLLHPLEVPLRGMEANPKVKGHIGQAGCDECYRRENCEQQHSPLPALLSPFWGAVVEDTGASPWAGPTLF